MLAFIQRIIASNVSWKNLSEEHFLLDYCCLCDQIIERLARLVSDYIVPMFLQFKFHNCLSGLMLDLTLI